MAACERGDVGSDGSAALGYASRGLKVEGFGNTVQGTLGVYDISVAIL